MATIEEKVEELASRLEIHAPEVWAKGEFELNNLSDGVDMAVTTLLITVIVGRGPDGRASPMSVALSCNHGMNLNMINYALREAMVDEDTDHKVHDVTLNVKGELKIG